MRHLALMFLRLTGSPVHYWMGMPVMELGGWADEIGKVASNGR